MATVFQFKFKAIYLLERAFDVVIQSCIYKLSVLQSSVTSIQYLYFITRIFKSRI